VKRPGEELVVSIDLLRHGHCQGGEIYRGSTDVELSEDGWQQMHRAVERTIEANAPSHPWDKIITSPLKRCRLISQHWAQTWDIPLAVEDGFRELSFGDWEGQLRADVHAKYGDQVRQFYRQPTEFVPPNGEPIQAMQERVLAAWRRVIDQHPGQRLLLVQHGVSIRVLLTSVLGFPLDKIASFAVPYAGSAQLNVYRHGDDFRTVLVSFNAVTPG
jgi:broad specificity phosphatase PhoE